MHNVYLYYLSLAVFCKEIKVVKNQNLWEDRINIFNTGKTMTYYLNITHRMTNLGVIYYFSFAIIYVFRNLR